MTFPPYADCLRPERCFSHGSAVGRPHGASVRWLRAHWGLKVQAHARTGQKTRGVFPRCFGLLCCLAMLSLATEKSAKQRQLRNGKCGKWRRSRCSRSAHPESSPVSLSRSVSVYVSLWLSRSVTVSCPSMSAKICYAVTCYAKTSNAQAFRLKCRALQAQYVSTGFRR